MTANSSVTWQWCPLCDPFGENTEVYLAKSRPTVRVAASGVGYCGSCGLRVDERAVRGGYDA